MTSEPVTSRQVLKVVAAAREAGVLVVYFQEVHRADHVDFGRELDGSEGVHCLEGAADTALDRRLLPRDDEYLVTKRRYSCFFGTDFLILLRGLGAETLLLTGELTDVCVHYTFVDAHQHDYHARVVTDCVGGSTRARHEASLDAMRYLQRDALCTGDEIVAALRGLHPPAVRTYARTRGECLSAGLSPAETEHGSVHAVRCGGSRRRRMFPA